MVVAQFSSSTSFKSWTSDKRTIGVPAGGQIAYSAIEPEVCGKTLVLDVWDYDETNPPDYDGGEFHGSDSAPCSDHEPEFEILLKRR